MAADGMNAPSMQNSSIATEMQMLSDLERVLTPYPKPSEKLISFHKRNAMNSDWEALSLNFRHQVSGYYMPSMLPSRDTKAVLFMFTGCEATMLLSTLPARSIQKRGVAIVNLSLIHNGVCKDPRDQITASAEISKQAVMDPDLVLRRYGLEGIPAAVAGQSAGAMTILTNLFDTRFAEKVKDMGNSVHYAVPFLGANGISRGYPLSDGITRFFQHAKRETANLAFDAYAHQNPSAILGTSRIDRVVTPKPSKVLCATRMEGHTFNAMGNQIVADIEDITGSSHPIFDLKTTAHIASDDEASCPRTATHAGNLLGWKMNPMTGGHQQLSRVLKYIERDIASDFDLN